MSVQLGDRVRFRIGRGHAVGWVVNTDGTIASVRTAAGKIVNRRTDALKKAEAEATPPAPAINLETIPADVGADAVC